MHFQDNIIKEYLKNVYFVTGNPCGGKTTISRALAKRHHLPVYDVDEQFDRHLSISDPSLQPAMNRKFANADAFFGRTVEEYRQWLLDNTREQLEFVLLDLMRLSQHGKVICDCHLTLEQAERFTDPARIVFLLKEPSNIIEDYCNRPDHQGFNHFINSASDPAKAKATCNETLRSLNADFYRAVKGSEYFWVERTPESTVQKTTHLVEEHFGLLR
jgi:hypothetical protein